MSHQIYFLQSSRPGGLVELSRGRTEQEAAPTRAASCRFSAPRTRRADGRHWRTQAAGASPDAAWQSYCGRRWLGRQRAHNNTKPLTADDTRAHARSSARAPQTEMCARTLARTQRPHQIGHEIKCYIKSTLIPDPFNPVVARFTGPK